MRGGIAADLSKQLSQTISTTLVEVTSQTLRNVVLPAGEIAIKALVDDMNQKVDRQKEVVVEENRELKREVSCETKMVIPVNVCKPVLTKSNLFLQIATMNMEMKHMKSQMEVMSSTLRQVVGSLNNLTLSSHNANSSKSNAGKINGGPKNLTGSDPVAEFKTKIMNMFQAGHYEAAFNEVLSKSDLEATRWAIEGASPVVAIPQLSQTVLLCLLQQLGASLGKKTENFSNELNWIEACSLRLDSNDSSISNHLDKVKRQVVTNLGTVAAISSDKNRVEVIKRIVKGI